MAEKDRSEENLMKIIGAVTELYEELDGKVATAKDIERVFKRAGVKKKTGAEFQKMADDMNDDRRENGLLNEA